MITTIVPRLMTLSLLCVTAAACDRRPAGAGAAADAPAVVKLPPVALSSDSAKPDTIQVHAETMSRVRTTLATNYAVLGAAITFGDRRMIATMYEPDATLATPDSTFSGITAIANALAALGPPKSLKAFIRTSRALSIVDSTVIDSGTYVTVSARSGADSTVEHGSYVAKWRMHAPPKYWALTADALIHGAKQPKKG